MMRLDQDRAMGQLASKAKCDVKDIDRVIIWGIHCMRDWALGTDSWISMAMPTNGAYGVKSGIYFSYPCISRFGTLAPVLNLPIDPYSAEMMEKSRKELFEERDAVAALLK